MIFGDTQPLPAAVAPNVRTAKCDFWDTQFDKLLAQHAQHGRPSHQPWNRPAAPCDTW